MRGRRLWRKEESMFLNRSDAGIRLAARLQHYKDRSDVIVLALPRGGVVTGYEIARELRAPLDVLIVRKIGVPSNPELAAGAVAETGRIVLNEDIVAQGYQSEDLLKREIERQKEEIAKRVAMYRAGNRLKGLNSRTVILVDDGIATGATIKAAMSVLREEKVAKLVLAVPVGPPETVRVLQTMADELVCLETPLFFAAVGVHYADFTQVSDDDVVSLLR